MPVDWGYHFSGSTGINYVSAAVLLGVEKAANTFGRGFTDHVAGLCSENLEDNIRAVRPFLRAIFEQQPSQDEFEVLVALNMVVPAAVRSGLLSRTIDRDAVMRALTVPVLVTQGAKDALVLASHTAHLRSCIAHAQASVYAGIGHAPPVEDPARFNRELAAFARQHAG
jgi:non-heme chloroperoxidase